MRILLGMSGGLDSSYAALKLIKEGHSVEGAVLIMHDYTEVQAARDAAREVGIPLHEIDARALFSEKVIPDFMMQYSKGRTPNPCIVCNREVKFRVLYDYAIEKGFDKIATGHYARIINKDGKNVIARSADVKKDQTYMLWRLPREIIDFLLFPLSDLTKEELRTLAAGEGLTSADRDESQEICFIPSGDYADYIEQRVGKSREGDFVDTEGNVLGRHKGIIHYTVGQRKGLGIALGQRAFITDIDPLTDRITLSFNTKETEEIYISDIKFPGMPPARAGEEAELYVKVRYLAPPVLARITFLQNDRARVRFSAPVRSVAPGQSAVCYDGDVMVLGGFIE